MHPNAHCSTIYNSQNMEATQLYINRGMDKEGVVHIHNGTLLTHKKNELMSFAATWMDFKIFLLNEQVIQRKTNI